MDVVVNILAHTLDRKSKNTNNTVHCFVFPPDGAATVSCIIPETGTSCM